MSWQAAAWAMEQGKNYDLEPISRYVLLILADYADKEGNDIYPSLKTLEHDTGLAERTIRRHIKHLMDVGLLDYGDQDVVKNNPKIRADLRPKCYRLVFNRDEATGAVDFHNFGKLPSANPARKTARKQAPKREETNDRSQSPAVEPVDNSTENDQRPDFDDSNGRTNDRSQSPTNHLNHKNKPQHAPAAPAVPVDHDAVRRLREASRARLAAKGFVITEPIEKGVRA